MSGQIITTSADVTLNGGLIRQLPQNPLNSGLGICPDMCQGRSTPMTFPYNRGWEKSTQFRRGLYTHYKVSY